MVALGRAARSAAISGRPELTKPLRKTPSIGQDMEGWMVSRPGKVRGRTADHVDGLIGHFCALEANLSASNYPGPAGCE